MIYVKMGVKRSIRGTARAQGKDKNTRQEWATRFSWRERALAYDRHVTALELSVLERDVIKHAQRRVKIADKVLSAVEDHLQEFNDFNGRNLTPFEMSRLLEVSTRLGEPAAAKRTDKAGAGVKFENVLIAIAQQDSDPRSITD